MKSTGAMRELKKQAEAAKCISAPRSRIYGYKQRVRSSNSADEDLGEEQAKELQERVSGQIATNSKFPVTRRESIRMPK